MELLIIILNREDYLQKILSLLVEVGVKGATIIHSEGLGHFLAYEVPIFAGLRHLIGERKGANRTILAVIEEEVFSKFKELLHEEEIDFTQPQTGIIVTLPIKEVIKHKL